MKLASLNVNGLRSHLDEIKLLTRSLDIQFIALNETKLDSNYSEELTSIPGYHQKPHERTSHEGGCSIYIRDSAKYKLLSGVLLMIWKLFA